MEFADVLSLVFMQSLRRRIWAIIMRIDWRRSAVENLSEYQ